MALWSRLQADKPATPDQAISAAAVLKRSRFAAPGALETKRRLSAGRRIG